MMAKFLLKARLLQQNLLLGKNLLPKNCVTGKVLSDHVKHLKFSFLLLFSMFIFLPATFSLEPLFDRVNISKSLVILTPSGTNYNGLPVFKVMNRDDSSVKKIKQILSESSAGYSMLLYNYAQQLLADNITIPKKEPAYLALTSNEGCFGLIGFYISENGKMIDKSGCGYIDLHKSFANRNYARLQSVTQLFPHEMAHVIQMLLSGKVTENNLPRSTDCHYFSITTDYRTAFSEGFAEHLENMSRFLEKDELIRKGIEMDTKTAWSNWLQFTPSFSRDFSWPARMEFFRAILPLRYQQFEAYKRYIWMSQNLSKFKTSGIGNPGSDDFILFRNTGLALDPSMTRTIAQGEANEGVVASFFFGLVNSGCRFFPLDSGKIKLFFSKDSISGKLNPLTNQYLKIFYILHKHIKTEQYGISLLHTFMKAYLIEFPEESNILYNVYKQATGQEFSADDIPELWMVARDYRHSHWVMAQYGLQSPYYSFDLNAADVCDLMTLQGVSEKSARKIIQVRDSLGYASSLYEIYTAGGLSTADYNTIKNSVISEMPEAEFPSRNFRSIIVYPLLNLGKNVIIWFSAFMLLFYFLYYRSHNRPVRLWKLIVMKFLNFILLTVIALICVLLTATPWLYFTIFLALWAAAKSGISRKDTPKRNEALISVLAMGIILIYSLI